MFQTLRQPIVPPTPLDSLFPQGMDPVSPRRRTVYAIKSQQLTPPPIPANAHTWSDDTLHTWSDDTTATWNLP